MTSVVDTPVGHIARFNLIQIGQILQTLALLPYEKPAAHFDELLSKLDWVGDCSGLGVDAK